jgi:nucleoside-diphosphate-sugar epimerase
LNILITGASGNLGSHTARHLLSTSHRLTLLKHKSPLLPDFMGRPDILVREGDLRRAETLRGLCSNIDCIVHFAGLLFAPRPGKFLQTTNVGYVTNLLDAALREGVKKFVLVSFPHAEGESTPTHPALGKVEASPRVIHFRTRLEAERQVLSVAASHGMASLVFRAGIVYGPEIKLVRAAQWLLRRRLLAIWKEPTWAHLVAIPDFLVALEAAIESEGARGIYQVCDDSPLLLQDFVDKLANHWNCARPMRLPAWTFHTAGALVETSALILRTTAFLNRDIVKAGMTSCVADTSRMKKELLPRLAYPTIDEGLSLL